MPLQPWRFVLFKFLTDLKGLKLRPEADKSKELEEEAGELEDGEIPD
jgi:hypothetical protein